MLETIGYLKKQLSGMGKEAQDLVEKRALLEREMQEIGIRLTQLSGAMTEIDRMIIEMEDEYETGNDSETGVSVSVKKVAGGKSTDKDSV